MIDGDDRYQNTLAEKVNVILQNEYLLRELRDLSEAEMVVSDLTGSYNVRRPHLSLKYKMPDEIRSAFLTE